ncbi:hypothetical protein [Actinomadura violacea]|uniref:Uncharacterized protein n=1 Tax=Actinomadura violacea TaxID=2819934 RepID=A0ABS3SAG6_9ACTN|nr:hypothetical protein [Actinomadura violacea]MBO2466002.1 hypothetical protein [Actinomadura violacea]
MDTFTPSEKPSEDGESTSATDDGDTASAAETSMDDGDTPSATETVKSLVKRNKAKILLGGALLTGVISVAIRFVEAQEATKAAADCDASERLPKLPVFEAPKRKSPVRHTVAPSKRTLPDGRIVEVRRYERGVPTV